MSEYVTDWYGSEDSARWRPDILAEIDRQTHEELSAIARLVAVHGDVTFDRAMDAVSDVNEHGPESRDWDICFGAMRNALAPKIDPILAKVAPEACDMVLKTLTPPMLSAFKQMVVQ